VGLAARRVALAARLPLRASRSAASAWASTTGSTRLPGNASRATASSAISCTKREISRARLLRSMESLPPPGGSVKPCAQPFTGVASGLSGCPFSRAVQPPYGSARTRVPPLAGAKVPVMPTTLDLTGVMVPSAAITRARATGPATCHRS
jgi:hypothetical protein